MARGLSREKMSKELPRDLKKVLWTMFKFAGYSKKTFDSVDFSQDNWYQRYTIKMKDLEKFKKWFNRELYNSKSLRYTIMENPIKNKVIISKTVDFFDFCYGLKNADETGSLKRKFSF